MPQGAPTVPSGVGRVNPDKRSAVSCPTLNRARYVVIFAGHLFLARTKSVQASPVQCPNLRPRSAQQQAAAAAIRPVSRSKWSSMSISDRGNTMDYNLLSDRVMVEDMDHDSIDKDKDIVSERASSDRSCPTGGAIDVTPTAQDAASEASRDAPVDGPLRSVKAKAYNWVLFSWHESLSQADKKAPRTFRRRPRQARAVATPLPPRAISRYSSPPSPPPSPQASGSRGVTSKERRGAARGASTATAALGRRKLTRSSVIPRLRQRSYSWACRGAIWLDRFSPRPPLAATRRGSMTTQPRSPTTT